MAKYLILPALMGLAVAACGSEPASAPANSLDAEQNAVANVPPGDNITARVMAMSDRERNVVFIRALIDAGIDCNGVSASERVEDYEGKPLWRASCRSPVADHLISITPAGVAEIITRIDR